MHVANTQEMGFAEIKERYLRPYYLQAAFVLGTLTLGLRTGAMNYVFAEDVSSARRARVHAHLSCGRATAAPGRGDGAGPRGRGARERGGGGCAHAPARGRASEPCVHRPHRPRPLTHRESPPAHPPAQPVGYLLTACVTGLLCTAIAWILFDFTDDPGGGERARRRA